MVSSRCPARAGAELFRLHSSVRLEPNELVFDLLHRDGNDLLSFPPGDG